MADTSIVFGILLAILGVYGFFTTHMEHPTALIPTGVGVLLAILGAVAKKEAYRKHAMHAAAVVGVLGFLAGAGRFFYELSKGMDVTGTAGMSTATMAVLCGVFVALCVKSFIDARRRPRLANSQP